MGNSLKILIIGGGISGLTLANLLCYGNNKDKFSITIFESQLMEGKEQNSIGGGIALWPPSQSVLQHLPNYQQFLENAAFPMPPPSYRDARGRMLARATADFATKFPIQSLNRDDLISWLLTNLQNKNNVEILSSHKITAYQRSGEKIIVKTHHGINYQGDLLVACDGIHSKIRNCLLAELQRPPIYPTELGYTYFRANSKVPICQAQKWWSIAFETWGSHSSDKHGNHELRFGYVPLKPPYVFWFIAIKTKTHHPILSPCKGVKIINDATKQFLIELVKFWQPVTNDSLRSCPSHLFK